MAKTPTTPAAKKSVKKSTAAKAAARNTDSGPARPSPALDTDDHYTLALDQAGAYSYFCSLHPRMTGRIVVE